MIADDPDIKFYTDIDEMPAPLTAAQLLTRLEVGSSSHDEQVAAVAGWLQRHEPSPALAERLTSAGLPSTA